MNMSVENKVAQTSSVLANAGALVAAICSEVLTSNELGSYQNVNLGTGQVLALSQTILEAEISNKLGA